MNRLTSVLAALVLTIATVVIGVGSATPAHADG